MAFGIFLHRADSTYDDSPAERYQFPRQYLARAEACVGDWIVYLEPKKVKATRGYFATAKVQRVIPDPANLKMYFAMIEPGSYLDFSSLVPFRRPDGIIETGVLSEQGGISGRAQSAVRPLSAADFNRIIGKGLEADDTVLPRVGHFPFPSGFGEPQAPFGQEQVSDRMRLLTSRVVRDRVFRQIVLREYDSQCAITGLRLINGSGRAEVEAAHIWPVEANGPDIASNGLALSGTAHWMFDRGLVGIDDDLDILISRHVNDAEGAAAMIRESRRLLPTLSPVNRPHPRFLRWHRENRLKG